MLSDYASFGSLFKKYRLKSEFATLAQFGNALAQEGFVYEDSIYSHWQKNVRVPKDRSLLITIIHIFSRRGGMKALSEANAFLFSAGQGHLTPEEINELEKKAPFSGEPISPPHILNFLLTTIQSKRVVRTGWTMMDISSPESVAEHSYQLCVMAMVLADQLGVDRVKLIKMALIHDLGEIFTGDIVWVRGNIIDIDKRRKKELIEAEGIKKIFKDTHKAEEYKSIFQEMVERKTAEADIFWQLDKLEMAIQALDYELRNKKDLGEFFVSVDLQITSPLIRSIFEVVVSARPKR